MISRSKEVARFTFESFHQLTLAFKFVKLSFLIDFGNIIA